MKAQFIYENLNFERGKDPKEAMDLGLGKKLEGYSLKEYDEYYGMSDMAINNIKAILKEKSSAKVYCIGVESTNEINKYNYETKSKSVDEINELIKNAFIGEQVGDLTEYKTTIGIIIEENISGYGNYYWGNQSTAAALRIWNEEPIFI